MRRDLSPSDFAALEARDEEVRQIARALGQPARNEEPSEVRDSMRILGRALALYLVVLALVVLLARVVVLNLPGV